MDSQGPRRHQALVEDADFFQCDILTHKGAIVKPHVEKQEYCVVCALDNPEAEYFIEENKRHGYIVYLCPKTLMFYVEVAKEKSVWRTEGSLPSSQETKVSSEASALSEQSKPEPKTKATH